MTKYTAAITEVIEYLVPVEASNEEEAAEKGEQLIVDTPDRDRYFVCCRVRECEGINKGWEKPDPKAPAALSTKLLSLARTLANMTTPMDGLVQRDAMHIDMVMAERSDDTLRSDADALYAMIEEARTILDAI